MSIIYIQPIFAPDEKRLRRNLDSIISFGAYIKKYPYHALDIVFGGWARDEFWTEIRQTINEHVGPQNAVKKFDKNCGKAVIVNTIYNGLEKKYNYLFTADSDIIYLEDQPHMFQRMEEVAHRSSALRKRKFGMIALNQQGQNCHLPDFVYQNRLKYDGAHGEEEIVWPHGHGGIAGGCLFTTTGCWEATGGYRIMGVYAGDDAYYLIDVMAKGFSIQMFESLSIRHPLDDDPEYNRWKVKTCQGESSAKKINIDKQIQEADEFWKKHGH